MIAAGAKAIPEGGYYSMPRMYGDGFMIIGDSAGHLNGARLKGIHLSIKAGILAAETALHALINDDYSANQLSEYESLFENSWAKDELWTQRNFHQAFEYGQLAGLVNAGLGIVTRGRPRSELRIECPRRAVAVHNGRAVFSGVPLLSAETTTSHRQANIRLGGHCTRVC